MQKVDTGRIEEAVRICCRMDDSGEGERDEINIEGSAEDGYDDNDIVLF